MSDKKDKVRPKTIAEAAKFANEKVSKLFEAKYDGISGKLPKWVPEPLQDEFHATRNHLLLKFSAKQILYHMEARQKLITFRGTDSTTYYPTELTHHLDTLIYIQKIVRLKEKEGMKAYLGKSGEKVVRGIVQSDIAKRPRTSALSIILTEILKENPKAKKTDVLSALQDYVGKGIVETIDSDSKIIEWVDKNGKIHGTSFKDLGPRLTRIKKNIFR